MELSVDSAGRALVLKPVSAGVIANYRIRIQERKDLINIISAILEEGSDLKYIELGESECSVGVFVIDNVMAERLMEKLQMRGVDVIEYATR